MPTRWQLDRDAAARANQQAARERDAEMRSGGVLQQDTLMEFTDPRCGHTWRSVRSAGTLLTQVREVCWTCCVGFPTEDAYVPPKRIVTDPGARPVRPYRFPSLDELEEGSIGTVATATDS